MDLGAFMSIRWQLSSSFVGGQLRRWTAVVLVAALALTHRALGEQTAPPSTNQGPCDTLVLDWAKCEQRSDGVCHLGDRITIQAKKECLGGWARAGHDPATLIPVINGRPLKGVHGDFSSLEQATFYFDLRPATKNDSNRQVWVAVLGDARNDLPMTWSLRSEDGALTSNAVRFQLQVFPGLVVLVSVMLFLALLVSFFILARRSDIVRDPGPPPAPNCRRYYSLGRTQMAFWFFVVLGTYLYIWLVTGDYDTLTPEVLALIGISAATGATAMVIDASGRKEALQALEAERDKIAAEIVSLQAQMNAAPPPANLSDLQAALRTKQARQAVIRAELSPASEGIVDILRDENGVSFHRFQMVGWTLVLGIVFLLGAYRDLHDARVRNDPPWPYGHKRRHLPWFQDSEKAELEPLGGHPEAVVDAAGLWFWSSLSGCPLRHPS